MHEVLPEEIDTPISVTGRARLAGQSVDGLVPLPEVREPATATGKL